MRRIIYDNRTVWMFPNTLSCCFNVFLFLWYFDLCKYNVRSKGHIEFDTNGTRTTDLWIVQFQEKNTSCQRYFNCKGMPNCLSVNILKSLELYVVKNIDTNAIFEVHHK